MALAVVLTLLSSSPPASAGTRALWDRSPNFRLDATLVDRRLTVFRRNLTDYPLHFRCTFVAHEADGSVTVLTAGDLNPGEVRRSIRRDQARFPSDARCRVAVRIGFELEWRSETFVVLAKGHAPKDAPPWTVLWFYNKTPSPLRMTCTWWENVSGSPVIFPSIWSEKLDGYATAGLSMGGVELGSIRGFTCAAYAQDEPAPMVVPDGLVTMLDADHHAFLVTWQSTSDGYVMQFVNRIDAPVTADCSWADSDMPDRMTYRRPFEGFEVRTVRGGSDSTTSSDMTCMLSAG